MTIRRVTRFSKKVYKAVIRLLPQLAPDAELPSEKLFKSMLASANTHFFVAELENEITGMISIATYNLISGTKFWIEDVVIDESQRGKGWGRELMLFAIGYAESLGAGSIMLTSRPSRVAANKLYVELGFERYETNVYKLTIPTKIWATPQSPQRGADSPILQLRS